MKLRCFDAALHGQETDARLVPLLTVSRRLMALRAVLVACLMMAWRMIAVNAAHASQGGPTWCRARYPEASRETKARKRPTIERQRRAG